MKRLLFMIAAALAVAFGMQTAFAQTATNARPDKRHTNGYELPSGQEAAASHMNYPHGPDRNKEYPASILTLDYLRPFMPKDIKVGVGWMTGKPCDLNGNFVQQAIANCRIYVSPSTGKTYLFRPSEQEGDSIFVWNSNAAEPYVHFNGGRYASSVVYQSPAAEQFAAANGYQLNPSSHTMVASTGAPPPAQKRTVDCKASNKSLGDIMGCANGTVNNSNVPEGEKPPAPAPVVAQAQDCSKLSMIARIKCEAMAAASK